MENADSSELKQHHYQHLGQPAGTYVLKGRFF